MAQTKKHKMIESFYVEPGKKAEKQFEWKKHDSEIKGQNQEVYFSLKSVLAPAHWSTTAIDIAASKYFRKTIKKENSINALVDRVTQGLSSAAKQSGLFSTPSEAAVFIEEIKFILLSQQAAFNSPVWFNLGLKEAYGLKSKSEHFVWNAKLKKVVSLNDAYAHPQTSACFIQSVDDNLESIFDLVKSEAKLFKYGSGSGTNFSNLRGQNEQLSSGGQSSGLISFLEVLDKAAGAIKSGGTTRRAAKMVCVDLDHPEIENFIQWKWREEEKAKSLIAAGYSADLDGETYKTVSGQNANNSVRVPDKFMNLLNQDAKWNLINRSNHKVYKTVLVDDLWNKICESAWNCADPGLQFDDTINSFHTCLNSGRINASNPCSEYMFLDNSACNLASLNLVRFLDEDQDFLLEEYLYTLRTVFMAQECLIDYSSYPTAAIAENMHRFRTLGLGFANLGSFIMRKGLAYDSDEARAWAAFLSSTLSAVAYLTSTEMAERLGPFAGYKENKTQVMKVMKKHKQAAARISSDLLPEGFKDWTVELWQQVLIRGEQFGFRNAQATAIAPTGTIGLVMDCDTTGIEPDFSLIKNKKLSGGGYLQIVNQSVEVALNVLQYPHDEIQKISDELIKTNSILKTSIKPEHHSIFSCATGDLALSPDAHLLMMAAVQPFISGAISKTVNLPNEATVKDISETYFKAWKLGLKSIALYRDGSKFVQPLSTKVVNMKTSPKCTECGFETVLESGCYRCVNCGTTTACSS